MQTFHPIREQALAEAQAILRQLIEENSMANFTEQRHHLERLLEIHDFVTEYNTYLKEPLCEPSSCIQQNVPEEVIVSSFIEPKEEDVELLDEEKVDEKENAEEEVCIVEEESLSSEELFEEGQESIYLNATEPSIVEKIEEAIQEEYNEENIEPLDISPESTEEIQEEAEVPLEEGATEEMPAEESQQEDSKMKLPNIKALHATGSLFEEANTPVQGEFFADTHPKVPKNFKLDLNDRIAFSAKLFDGSQLELNETVKILNSFETLDEAKEYLSDVYYQRNWEKVDEYAQRLWSLVENKFM